MDRERSKFKSVLPRFDVIFQRPFGNFLARSHWLHVHEISREANPRPSYLV